MGTPPFLLDPPYEEIRAAVREFAQRELAPRAAAYDESGEFPWENVRKLAEHGYLGMMIPEAYGGGGMDTLAHAICLEEVARACAATAVVMDVHNSLVGELINRWASEDMKARWLPVLARGDRLGAFCLTEPDAGSDAAALKTTAVRDGDHYVLNGRKTFISNGGVAEIYVVFAVTDPAAGSRGISAFLVEKGTPGLSFGKPFKKMGIRASSTTDVILEQVRVPASHLIGREGQGYKIALATLDNGRVGIGAQAVGIAQAALDRAVAYASQRRQFGRPIGSFQGIQFKLADMATQIEAARLLVYRAAVLYDESVRTGRRASKEIAMAKLFASEVAMQVTTEAVQIHGGYGYLQDFEVERLMRDAKITQIYEGTSEVQRMVIARALLAEAGQAVEAAV
ncbi:butyryl-CoA dehydrogenase [Thermaerobacter marianensis DSM 12885]|uniref:Butyryl-CoA dehydrogenase n=1 Tax=Thermaerobacter marianensis (strain ATCC 700841 / DSM 12885 / JCM 10246 / 7p75a) TaxID=644966 RepID=E6SLR9_THEM7|nr:acyl-CoA dehydrogenase [Thermaerobacter marianensis]ADU51368.1 butyryl-CoA dehydrogenase [Thermaerobacter marianensis DSM 12885]